MSLIEKIDAMEKKPFMTLDMNMGYARAIDDVRKIILSEQKNPCENCIGPSLALSRGIKDMRIKECTSSCQRYKDENCDPNILGQCTEPLTIGDKIRESNESLAEAIDSFRACNKCFQRGNNCFPNYNTLDYLNQPYKD